MYEEHNKEAFGPPVPECGRHPQKPSPSLQARGSGPAGQVTHGPKLRGQQLLFCPRQVSAGLSPQKGREEVNYVMRPASKALQETGQGF